LTLLDILVACLLTYSGIQKLTTAYETETKSITIFVAQFEKPNQATLCS